jgi:hypothetical protein
MRSLDVDMQVSHYQIVIIMILLSHCLLFPYFKFQFLSLSLSLVLLDPRYQNPLA